MSNDPKKDFMYALLAMDSYNRHADREKVKMGETARALLGIIEPI